jgi:hypothetical protein
MAEKRITSTPLPGQTIIVRAEAGQDIVLDFDLDTANVKTDGKIVTFEFPGGGQIVLDFTDLGPAAMPNIILADGTALSVDEYLASLGLTDLEPAAGGDAGADSGGVGEYNDDPGQRIDGLDMLNGLGPRPFASGVDPSIEAAGGLNTVPDAVDDADEVSEGVVTTTGNILANDTLNGATLISVQHQGVVYVPAPGETSLTITTGLGGQFVINLETGEYTYTSPPSVDHSQGDVIEEFFYTLRDGDGDTDSAVLTINILDIVPLAEPDYNSVPEGGETVYGNILDNDSLLDGATLVRFEGQEFGSDGTLTFTTPMGGVLVISSDGSYAYTPPATADHSGADPLQEIFNYTLRDIDGDEADSTLTIDVLDIEPVANPDYNTVPEGGVPVSGNILTNDQLLDQAVLVSVGDQTFGPGVSLTINTSIGGQLVIFANGDYTYTPPASADHTGVDFLREIFEYSLLDRDGDLAESTLTIDVTDIEPVARPDVNTVVEGAPPVTGNILGNDTLVDGANLVSFEGQAFGPGGSLTFNTPIGGVLVINADGSYIYTPPASAFHGASDSLLEVFNYTLQDRDGDVSSSTLTINVLDLVPDAVDDTNFVVEGAGPVAGNILLNDDVGEGAAISQIVHNGVTFFANPLNPTQTISTGQGGTLTINFQTGTYSYTPPSSANHASGPVFDQFVYTLTDTDGDSDTATLTITIGDTVPTALDDRHDWTWGQSEVTGNVIAGTPLPGGQADIPGQDGPVSVIGFEWRGGTYNAGQTVTNGGSTFLLNADGSYIYTPSIGDGRTVWYSLEEEINRLEGILEADSFREDYPNILVPSELDPAPAVFTSRGIGVNESTGIGDTTDIDSIDSSRAQGSQGLIFKIDPNVLTLHLRVESRFDYDEELEIDYFDNDDICMVTVYGIDGNAIHEFRYQFNGTQDVDINLSALLNFGNFGYVGVRAVDFEARDNVFLPSAFYVTHLETVAASFAPEEIRYTITDTDGDTSSALLTLNPVLPDQEFPQARGFDYDDGLDVLYTGNPDIV